MDVSEAEATTAFIEEPKPDREAVSPSSPSTKTYGPDVAVSTSAGGCFDCNICLDFASEPVVTLCGHLYCWPCIYRWLHQKPDLAAVENRPSSPQCCPVCKASLSQDSLVPLYSRGQTVKPSLHKDGGRVPRRPSSRRPESPIAGGGGDDDREDDDEVLPSVDIYSSPVNLGRRRIFDRPLSFTSSSPRVMQSTAGGALEGMAIAVLPWALRRRNPESGYSSPRIGRGGMMSPSPSARMRRQEMRVERSLHQIWVFLFCCALLCLLLF